MAMSDYCLCEVCGMKTFYDANINYEPSDKAREDGGCSLERTAAMSAICKDCWAKGYRLKVVSIEDDDEIARLRADRDNAGAVMVEACRAECQNVASTYDNMGEYQAERGAERCAEALKPLSTLSPIAAAARVLLADKAALQIVAQSIAAEPGPTVDVLRHGLLSLAEQEKADG